MVEDSGSSLDRRLQDAFQPDPRVVSRVAVAALADATPERRRARLGAMAAVAAVFLAAAWAFWAWRPPAPLESGAPALSGMLRGGVLVVTEPGGSITVTGGEVRRDRPGSGYGMVLVEGELR